MIERAKLAPARPRRTILDALLDELGYKHTLELCRRFHGRKLLIPLRVPDIHPLRLTIGDWAASRLEVLYGGDVLEIPDEFTVVRIRRDAEIRRRRLGGEGLHELGQAFGLTRKQIRRILGEENGNGHAVAIQP